MATRGSEATDLERNAEGKELATDARTDEHESLTTLSTDEVGKDVVDASGENVMMVTDVADDGKAVYVDAHPNIAERIEAALDWAVPTRTTIASNWNRSVQSRATRSSPSPPTRWKR
jgi:hypothetical protein